jgi:hypothetical protein
MKTKFTIADKEEAREILLNDPNLSQEDIEFLSTNPVFAEIVKLFKSNYDLLLMSKDDFKRTFKGSYWTSEASEHLENYVYVSSSIRCSSCCEYDSLVSLENDENDENDEPIFKIFDALVATKKPKKKIKKSSKEFLDENEVEEMDSDLHRKIENYVNENIANWTEMCECEEEGDALEFFLDHHLPSWRVRNDGTVDVIVESESRESFNFEWEDNEGEERTSNAIDLLQGNVSHEFDDDCNNEFVWDNGIEKEVIALFKSRKKASARLS